MNARAMQEYDVPKVKSIHEASEMPFEFPEPFDAMIEARGVVTDDEGNVILAALAKRTVELYLFCPKGGVHPMVKLEAIRQLHEQLRGTLVAKGYHEASVFVAPHIEQSFGRHMSKYFGWLKSWPAWVVRDWKQK